MKQFDATSAAESMLETWRRDEQARVDEAAGAPMPPCDADEFISRIVARGLATPLPDCLPIDFANRMAARAVMRPPCREWDGLLIGISISAIFTSMILYGGLLVGGAGAAAGLVRSMVEPAENPPLALAIGCIAIAWILKLLLYDLLDHRTYY